MTNSLDRTARETCRQLANNNNNKRFEIEIIKQVLQPDGAGLPNGISLMMES